MIAVMQFGDFRMLKVVNQLELHKMGLRIFINFYELHIKDNEKNFKDRVSRLFVKYKHSCR